MTERHAGCVRAVSVGLLVLLCAAGVPASASEWICTNGNYSNASCWLPPGMPSGENVIVEIPGYKGTITLDVSAQAKTLWLYEDTTLRIPAGKVYRVVNEATVYGIIDASGDFHAFKAYLDGTIKASAGNVTVQQADIYGIIDANGGNFTAASATLHGDKAQVRARRGGQAIIPAGVYSAVGCKRSSTLMLSEGTNADRTPSLLDLSAVTELNDGFSADTSADITHAITARDGGVIDLSGLTTLVGPSEHNSLRIQVNAGGNIRLDRLAQISTANTNGSGTVWFELDGPGVEVNLPALVSISSTEFHATNGARLTAGGSASSGSFVYSAAQADVGDWDYELLSADSGSVLDLSAMSELDDGFSNPSYKDRMHTIVASNGGEILLSGLRTIVGPGDDEDLSIQANSGGRIDLSALRTITGGTGSVNFDLDRQGTISLGDVTVDAVTHITLRGGSTLEAQALRATKAMTIALDGGSRLHLQHLQATKDVTITLNDPRDVLEIEGDFDLDARITIFNPGRASLVLRGDFTRSHNGEPGLDLSTSRMYFAGQGPQELEIGGWDIGTTTKTDRGSKVIRDLLNGNFGFGRMVVGQPDRPTAILLADNIDNGNRYDFAGDLYSEALYLFGDADPGDPNGLRIEKGSTLYMGGLRVYAMLDGKLTDLSTLFEPNQVVIHGFSDGGGDLHLGRPDVNDCRNVVRNGGFESGDNPPTWADPLRPILPQATNLAPWEIVQNTLDWTHEARFTDAGAGQRFADLSSTSPGPRILRQKIHTQVGTSYHVWFDVAPNPYGPKKSGSVTVRADGSDSMPEWFDLAPTDLVGSAPAAGHPWLVRWETKTWRFTARGDTTTLEFAAGEGQGAAPGLALDNVVVLSPDANYPPDCFRLADDWFLNKDTGIDPNDKLTTDTAPELILPFTKPVWGADDGITIEGPAGPLAISISGWNSDVLRVTFPTPLAQEGRYVVTLQNTILDTLGEFLNGGVRHTTLSFVLDKTPPVAGVDSLVIRNTSPRLTGQVDDADARVEVTVAGRTWWAVNNRDGTWTLPANTIQPPLTDGEYKVNITATDRAGNISSGGGWLTADTTPPVVGVDSLLTRDPTPSLVGRVDDPNATVEVTLAGKTYPAQNRGDGTWMLPNATIDPPLTDGSYEVRAAATDQAGNVGYGSGSLTLDVTAPSPAVDTLLTRDTTPPLTGSVNDPDATVTVTVAGKTYAANNNGDGTWTLPDNTIDPPLPDGVHEVKVTTTDSLGNVGGITAQTLTVDNTPPAIAPQYLSTTEQSPELAGPVDDPQAVIAVTIEGRTYPAVNDGKGTWRVAAGTIGSLNNGTTYEGTIAATDLLGNTCTVPLTLVIEGP